MRCLSPLNVESKYNEKEKKFTHKIKHKGFDHGDSSGYMVSCGQCIACRINRARMWSIRNAHEAMFHNQHCFITLTYNEQHLPPDLSVSNQEHQNFIKRLRKHIGKPIKYYMAAEYGQPTLEEQKLKLSNIGRPHYHYLIYGWEPPDLKLAPKQDKWRRNKYYTSEIVNSCWTAPPKDNPSAHPSKWESKGFDIIGSVTADSAAYVAGYCTKKMTGDQQDTHYKRINPRNGELIQATPEFQRCSQGIGKRFVERYHTDLRKGFITNDGKTYPIPRFYLKVLHKLCEDETDQRVKNEYIDTLDQIQLNQMNTELFEELPDFQKLQYSYNVAKVYKERSKERQFLNDI